VVDLMGGGGTEGLGPFPALAYHEG